MAPPRKYNPSDEELLEAIKGSGGIKKIIGKRLGIENGDTIDHVIKRSAKGSIALRMEQEGTLDLAEIGLLKAIKAGEAWAIKFVLKTKGRHRGYNERIELANEENKGFVIEDSERVKDLEQQLAELKELKNG